MTGITTKILIGILLSIVISPRITTAQAPQWQWAKLFGGCGVDWPAEIVCDGENNIYLTGAYSDTATFDSHILAQAGSHFFLTKLSSKGEVLWIKHSETPYPSNEGAFVVCHQQDVYLMIGFQDSIRIENKTVYASHTNSFGNEYVIVKYSSRGEYQWARRLLDTNVSNSAGNLEIEKFSADSAGNLFFCGDLSGSTSILGTQRYARQPSFFVIKTDSNANLEWMNMAETVSGSSYGVSLGEDAAGNSYLAGNFVDTLGIDRQTIISKGGRDIFLAKYDAAGSLLWLKDFGSHRDDWASGMCVQKNGMISFDGNFFDTLDFGNGIRVIDPDSTWNANSQMFLVQCDSSGDPRWAFNSEVEEDSEIDDDDDLATFANDISQDKVGNIYFAADFLGDEKFASQSIGVQTPSLMAGKVSAEGKVEWLKSSSEIPSSQFGSIGSSHYSMTVDGDGNSYYSGYMVNSRRFDNIVLNSIIPEDTTTPTIDIFIARLGSIPNSVSDGKNFNKDIFTFFPNPASTRSTIAFALSNPSKVAIEIFDLLGRKIVEISFGDLSAGEHSESLDLQSLPTGSYLCRMTVGGKASSVPFTIVK